MILPNFLIAGTGNSGTSFLSACLMQHPEIYLPKNMRPEPHYFYYNHHYEQPIEYYYENWFSKVKNEKAIGERSSSYLFHPECAMRISKGLPNIKLIFVLRNPIERTWANYRFTVFNGLEDLSFEQALEQEEERCLSSVGIWKEVLPFSYKGRSFYGRQIKTYLKFFSPYQILIISSENLREKPYEQIEKVLKFLGVSTKVDINLPSDFSSLAVISASTQAQCREYFKERFNLVLENMRCGLSSDDLIVDRLDHHYMNILKENCTNTKPVLDFRVRQKLVNIFTEDIDLFFSLTKGMLDFSSEKWMNNG